MAKIATVSTIEAGELVITRDFDAPRALVFAAWTDPDHARHWWGPKDYPATHLEMDVRPGGKWRNRLTSTETGRDLWHGGVFREVVPPERLVFTFAWEEDGERGLETVVTVTFAERGGRTRMTFRQAPFRSAGERDGHAGGWTSCFDRLTEHLAAPHATAPVARREVTLTRTIAAPRDLVWAMWTEPRHLARWWGPDGFTNPVCELDLRPGGAIRIDMRAPDGTVHPMTGTVREVVRPERLVFVAVARDRDGNALLELLTTVTLAELGGQTRLTVQASAVAFVDAAIRMIDGMEAGWSQSLERLATASARNC